MSIQAKAARRRRQRIAAITRHHTTSPGRGQFETVHHRPHHNRGVNETSYPAARIVAATVYAHFAQRLEEAAARGETELAVLPDEAAIATMIDAAFWASLRREEGYVPKISLAFLGPAQTPFPMMLERPLSLDPGALTKVAPAVERAGIHLAVSGRGHDLSVWGTAEAVPRYCCIIEVAQPGLLVVKHHRGDEAAKFINVAVLQGDQIKAIDEHANTLPDCPDLISSLVGFDSPASWTTSTNLLVQLAVSMRAHGRGGTLVVVPPATAAWHDSVVHPISYAVSPAFAELSLLVRERPSEDQQRGWQEALARAIGHVAGLTAVDGAVVLNADYELLAFGAKITRRRGSALVEQVTVTEPIRGAEAMVVNPSALGGTRHLSAAQFVHDQRDATALVASQDGRFTVFAWSPCENMVHAHRVESLLL